jgi:hypothetical protein
MTTQQALKDKLMELRLKAVADQLDTVIEAAATQNLDLLSTLSEAYPIVKTKMSKN